MGRRRRHASRSPSRSSSGSDGSHPRAGKLKKSRRQFRKRGEDANAKRKAEDPVAQLKIEAEMAARVAAKAKERVEEAMQSDEVQKTIESRLREERANLEGKVAMQLEAEKAALLQRKREQQVERKRKQDELDRILQENKRKVEEAQQRAADDRKRREEGNNLSRFTAGQMANGQKIQGIQIVDGII